MLFCEFFNNIIELMFVQICWNDYIVLQCMCLVLFCKFMILLEVGRLLDIGIIKVVFGMIQNDYFILSFLVIGEYCLYFDFFFFKYGFVVGYISMYGEFCEQDGFFVVFCL